MSFLPNPVLPRSIQIQLGLRDPRFRPLSDVKTVLRDLGEFEIDSDHIRELVEQGILVGFNISARRNGDMQDLRILTSSIKHFQETRGKYYTKEWPAIFSEIVQHKKPVLTGLEIRRILICSRGHIINLLDGGHLKALKKSQPGPGGSWTITRESFETFLSNRRQ